MDHRNRLMTFLVDMFALRRRRDYVIKPALWVGMVFLISTVSEMMVRPDDMNSAASRLSMVVVTSLPFSMLVFTIINYLDVLQNKLAELATTDVLTGLPNRRAFLDRSTHLNQRSSPGMLAIIDADHFKRINDTYGHAVGDLCLQAIARQLRTVTRSEDVLGRLGGEEFAIYFNSLRPEDALALAEKLTAEIKVDLEEPEQALGLTLSVGAAPTSPADSIEISLKRADEALYDAKRAGRACLVVWKEAPDNSMARAG